VVLTDSMPEEKKSRKNDIEKLRKVLDNPRDEKLKKTISRDEVYLDSIRKRLSGEPSERETKYGQSSDFLRSDSLEPQVTIYPKEETIPRAETTPVEPEEKKEPPEAVIVEAEDLYEIEKVEAQPPEFLEVKPEELPKEETPVGKMEPLREEKVGEREVVPELEEEALPEWIPLEKIEPEVRKPAGEKPVEPEVPEKEALPLWEPVEIKEVEKKEEEKPPGKPEIEKIPFIVRDGKTDVFQDIRSIDQRTAALLYENGFTSVDALRKAAVDDLIQVQGVKKRLAKKIKKEIDKLDKEAKKGARKKVRIAPKKPEKKKEKPAKREISKSKKGKPKKKTGAYTHGEYSLYKKEIATTEGKTRTIHFFSKKKPEAGEPVPLPDGFEVEINKKTGLPYLKKKQ